MFIVEDRAKKLSASVYTLSDYTDKINRAISNIRKEYVYIGGLLNEINTFEQYKELGFDSIVEYCESTFGFKKSFTYNLMNVQRKFNNGTIFNLDEKYEKFDFSKLVVMSSMNDLQIARCKPDMTVNQIKDIKRNSFHSTRVEKVKITHSDSSEISENVVFQFSNQIEDYRNLSDLCDKIETYLFDNYSKFENHTLLIRFIEE